MSAEPISMQEWLSHATPNTPWAVIRDEARKLAEEPFSWDEHFAEVNERRQYDGDEQ